jgi:outer membrane protein assembly factor BamB
MKYKFFLSILISAYIVPCFSIDWPQYLGPDRNASAKNEKISINWPETGPEKLWEDTVGSGFGGASIHNGEVFILDRIDGEKDVLRCFDINTGKEMWRFSYEAKGESGYPGSRNIPAVDKDYVWTVGPFGHIFCISRATHQPVWNKNLFADFQVDSMQFGISQSPLLYKNLIIVAPQSKKAGIVAFDKITGDVVWTTRKLKGTPCYSSPTLGNIEGVDQVIMLSPYSKKDSTLTNEIAAFDAQTGKELWVYDRLHSFSIIAPAVVLENNRVLITDCSYNDKFSPVTMMFEVKKDGDKYAINELFLTQKAGCKMHPPVVHNGYIYLNNNGKPNSMECLSMKGEVMWTTDSINFEMGGLILVGDYIIAQNGKNGDLSLLQPSPDGYKELGKASLFHSNKSQAWSPLAYSNGKLVVRDNEKIVCVDLKN